MSGKQHRTLWSYDYAEYHRTITNEKFNNLMKSTSCTWIAEIISACAMIMDSNTNNNNNNVFNYIALSPTTYSLVFLGNESRKEVDDDINMMSEYD